MQLGVDVMIDFLTEQKILQKDTSSKNALLSFKMHVTNSGGSRIFECK